LFEGVSLPENGYELGFIVFVHEIFLLIMLFLFSDCEKGV